MTRGAAAAAGIAGCTALAAILHLPYLHAGLGPDEGGYAYVAEEWARGARLYGTAWVDRPQGLLLVYRLLLDLAHTAWAIRLGALLFACGVTALVGAIGWLLRGPGTGVAAAAVTAVVGVGPHIQGFTFDGELAAALPAAGAVAAALAWRRSGRGAWLVLAGLLGGLAPLLKQSAFDGLVVAAAVAFAGGRRRAAAVVAGAASVPLCASALHGLLVGWPAYWSAVVAYKLDASRPTLHQRLGLLSLSLERAAPDVALPAALAAAGVAAALIRGRREGLWIPSLWLVAALAGFNAGGLYWPHYYVQLVAPLSLLAALAATGLAREPAAAAALALACTIPVLAWVVALERMSPARRALAIPFASEYQRDERVARLLRARSRPRDSLYVLNSEADLYFLAGRRSVYPYLWGHPMKQIPTALPRLRRLLAGPGGPDWVVVYTPPDRVDRSGGLESLLLAHYRLDETVAGTRVAIFRRSARPVARPARAHRRMPLLSFAVPCPQPTSSTSTSTPSSRSWTAHVASPPSRSAPPSSRCPPSRSPTTARSPARSSSTGPRASRA